MSDMWVSLEQVDEGVHRLRIERERALNALNADVLDQIESALNRIEADASSRVLIVTGQGTKAFVAGADIEAISRVDNEAAALAFAERGQRLFRRFEESSVITIAAINGYALGGGLELAMALDFRVAAQTARLGQPEINLGIIPGFGGTQRLSRLIGPGQALWMIGSGEPVTADEAKSLGLVDVVVPAEELMDECLRRAHVFAQKAPLALAASKRLVQGSRDWPLENGLHREAEAFSNLAVSLDGREGTRAFLEKRSPKFQGR